MAPKAFANRWKVIRELVPGGQSWTYLVEDLTNPGTEPFVLKRLKNLDRIKRFEHEIDAIKTLDHPNIIQLVDFDLNDEAPFLVTKYYAGGELEGTMASQLSPIEKLRLFSIICVAIAHAHEKGVIHRDIKPPNILFEEGPTTPVVADFGICISTELGIERVTELQEQVGARFYMAPELADGKLEDVTPASDVYSLGKLLYWLFAGRVFDREKHLHPSWDLRTDSSDIIMLSIYDNIFSKTIVEDPAMRFLNGTELWKEVQKIIGSAEKNGRYLDADVPSDCIFCGVGKYSEKQIIPRLTSLPHNPQTGRTMEYELDYRNSYGFSFHASTNRLPIGNIENGSYQSFLIMKCDHCGNLQTFHFEQHNADWKNARPEKP
ncbi:MAG: serine/threonine protein kinase [Pyrinomonadaceae bacterium]